MTDLKLMRPVPGILINVSLVNSPLISAAYNHFINTALIVLTPNALDTLTKYVPEGRPVA